MKVLGICCSPRKGRETFKAMEVCLAAASEVDEKIDTELVELAGRQIGPCIACNICKDGLICGIDDDFGELVPVLADKTVAGIIIGTPVYFGSMTAQCKALLDRCVVLRRNGWLLRDKVCGVLAVGGVRHGGQEMTLQVVRAAMLCHDMLCVGDGKPTGHFGAALYSGGQGGVEADEDGLETARNLGRRVGQVALRWNETNHAASWNKDKSMNDPMKVVIVGGVAAGPKVASKIIRLMPNAEVTIVERGQLLSYAGCGLPYYVSGVVKEQAELLSTPIGVVRDPAFFRKVKNVRVLNQTEATEIDRPGKRLRIRSIVEGDESWLDYDKLVLATGASPVVPPIDGVKLDNIFTLHGVHDAEGIKSVLADEKAHDVVIVGGGLIGVEVTEALAERGCRVTIVEMLPQILRMLDWQMARLVAQHMESHGVKVLTDTKVLRFEGDGKVAGVVTDKGSLAADMVILAIGVRPNVNLAEEAALEIGSTGAIKVDEHLQTSDPDIYAAGDCVESVDLVTGSPCYVPLGSTANKQGRVVAVNVCGGNDTFPGVLGSTVCKVFDHCVARTGLTEEAARQAGYDVTVAMVPGPDKAHYMPDAKRLLLRLIVDSKTRRLLGAEAIGPGAGDKRIDVAAMAITAGMTVDQIANADLCYAPPYAPAMDNIITAANVARNKLDGYMIGVTADEVHRMLEQEADFVFLDVRSEGEYDRVRLGGSTLIPLGALRGRLDELPSDKEIIVFCAASLRGYEAGLILRAAGFENVRVMDGGIAMWPYEKLT